MFWNIFLLSLLALYLLGLIFALNALYTWLKVKVPYVHTADWVIKKIAGTIKLKPGAVVYELGAGDCRILIALKKQFSDIQAVGYELAWWPFLIAKLRIKFSGLRIELCRKNFYQADLSQADLIYCYLFDSVMPKLEKKLLAELKPDSQVISYGFRFPNWQPREIIANPKNLKGSKINIYQK